MSDSWPQPVTVDGMYGDWDYDAAVEVLGRSLSPRSASSIVDVVGSLGAGTNDIVLDVGGREGQHALLIAERFGCRAISVDPVPENNARGQDLVDEHEYGHLVELRLGSIEQIPAADGAFQIILARDMLGHIEDLSVAMTECRRVLSSSGHMVIFGVFATPLLYPEERRRLCADAATVPERLSVEDFEEVAVASGFSIDSTEILGSEHVEASQESGTAPNYLLQVSRLRRDKERLVEELGVVPYRVMYANALWSIYRLIGKLESRIYVLRRDEI